jgi:hypothetical protein
MLRRVLGLIVGLSALVFIYTMLAAAPLFNVLVDESSVATAAATQWRYTAVMFAAVLALYVLAGLLVAGWSGLAGRRAAVTALSAAVLSVLAAALEAQVLLFVPLLVLQTLTSTFGAIILTVAVLAAEPVAIMWLLCWAASRIGTRRTSDST